MKKTIFLAIILGLALGFTGINAHAEEPAATQPAAAPAMPAAEGQEAYGEVISVDANAGAITITEYDYEKDEDINKTYTIDKAATYENVKSLAEVKAGDWVALTLKPQKDGSNLAASVYVERYDVGEEPAPAAAPVMPATTTAPAVTAPAEMPATEMPNATTTSPAAAEAPAATEEAPAQQ